MSADLARRFCVTPDVFVTVTPDRTVTIHTEGVDIPVDTIAVMMALGTPQQPWHETVTLLHTWSHEVPNVSVGAAVQYAKENAARRLTAVSYLAPTDPLLLLAAKDPDSDVRAHVAHIAALQPGGEDILALLATDPHWWVRACVCSGDVVPVQLIDRLAAEPYPPVQTHLIGCKQPLSPAAVRSLLGAAPPVRAAMQRRQDQERAALTR